MVKTLIVEDNRLNRETLKGLFRRYFPSMSVEEASDRQEAMKKFESFQPDLVLMDIRLPDGSGMELTKKIKETNPDVKVLIITGHHYAEYKEAAAQCGADGFLVKGGSSVEMLAAVEALLPKTKEVVSPDKQ